MRWLIPLLLSSLCSPAFAAGKSKYDMDAADEVRPPIAIGLRGGFLMNTPDDAVVRKWEHAEFKSYQVALSGFYSFPPKWKQAYFFAGPEFYYQNSTEELSTSNYTTSIEIDTYQLMLTGGYAYQPYWANGFGASFATAIRVWGQKTATLDTPGFTQDLGTERMGGFSSRSGPINVILAFYYNYGALRPQLVFESNSSIGMGLAYAF